MNGLDGNATATQMCLTFGRARTFALISHSIANISAVAPALELFCGIINVTLFGDTPAHLLLIHVHVTK